MKLLIYSHFFAPSVGGVETLVLSLARGLAALRSLSGDPEFEITLATQTSAERFDDTSLPFRVVREPNLIHLWDLIRASDVVHVAGPALAPLFLGLLARKPIVVEHHGFQTICPNGQLLIEPAGAPCPGHFMAGRHGECLRCNSGVGWFASRKLWLLTFVRRFLCRSILTNITPTAWLGGLIQLPRVAAIPHGLEFIGSPVAYPESASRPAVIAFQGRLVTTKGVGIFMEAARSLLAENRAVELIIIGDGPERASLERLSQDAPLAGHVRFAGRLLAAELDAALAHASVVVVPSLGGEVFGLVVAENMSRGLPVITSDLGAFVEVLGEGGLTFRTGDAAALARELSRILDDPALAARLGKIARQRALEFCDFHHMLESHARVYKGICSR
ncbi:MAG TPA: glycosyltransferase family 4 protein [Candidatus Acidoferrum sp.]|nr:glycosyltransferase family 4 protein [Candidatus Acidoferrum sp.]